MVRKSTPPGRSTRCMAWKAARTSLHDSRTPQAATKWVGTGVGVNGADVTFKGIDIFEINDAGKIQRLWSYWDPESLMKEIMS